MIRNCIVDTADLLSIHPSIAILRILFIFRVGLAGVGIGILNRFFIFGEIAEVIVAEAVGIEAEAEAGFAIEIVTERIAEAVVEVFAVVVVGKKLC